MEMFECDAPIVVAVEGEKSETIEDVAVACFRFLHDGLQLFLSENISAFRRFLVIRWTMLDRIVRRMAGRRR